MDHQRLAWRFALIWIIVAVSAAVVAPDQPSVDPDGDGESCGHAGDSMARHR